MPSESRRPMSEVYPSGYSAFSRTSAQATSAVPTKEPLRKVSSLDSRSPNSESSNRRSPSTNAGQQKPGISDKARTFPRQWPTESKWHIARQSSKVSKSWETLCCGQCYMQQPSFIVSSSEIVMHSVAHNAARVRGSFAYTVATKKQLDPVRTSHNFVWHYNEANRVP